MGSGVKNPCCGGLFSPKQGEKIRVTTWVKLAKKTQCVDTSENRKSELLRLVKLSLLCRLMSLYQFHYIGITGNNYAALSSLSGLSHREEELLSTTFIHQERNTECSPQAFLPA